MQAVQPKSLLQYVKVRPGAAAHQLTHSHQPLKNKYYITTGWYGCERYMWFQQYGDILYIITANTNLDTNYLAKQQCQYSTEIV